jgi:hypothetical protein
MSEHNYGCMGKDCYERVDFTININCEQIYADGLLVCPKCNTPRPRFAKMCVLAKCGRGECTISLTPDMIAWASSDDECEVEDG